MKYDFDTYFDRSNTKCRKWDNNLVKKRYNLTDGFIPMHIADMDFPIAKPIVDAVVKRASIPDYSYIYTYDEYYKAVIHWNNHRHNILYKKEWIKLMFGTNGSIKYAVQTFCKQGDSVIINTPIYSPLAEAVYDRNCKLIKSPLLLKDNRYFFNFEDIENKIIKHKVKLYILCSPHNPSGRIWTKDELNKICEICIKHNVLLVCDEVHSEIVFNQKQFSTIMNTHSDIAENCIVCKSPNKAFNLGGLKSSYIIIKNQKLRNQMLEYLDKVYITSPHIFIIPAVVAAYNKCENWLDELTSYIENNCNKFYDFMKKYFPNVKVMKADSSYLVWAYFGDMFKNEEKILRLFQKANIAIEIGSHFVSDGNLWVRFNLGTQYQVLDDAFKRLIDAKKLYL